STQFQFFTSETGEIAKVALKLEPTISAIEFKRTPIKMDVSKDALAQYAGEYELAGVVTKFFVKGTTLHLIVPGQPEYELVSIGKHKFMIKGFEGFKIEFIENNGSFPEVVFNQPNGVFKGKRK
ncbi:MAG TPA: serine hydrolase, partial [Cyclobacteriaceae bacterium]|nr:serine hydrolase [Cyclobacteriaceae bacterium]